MSDELARASEDMRAYVDAERKYAKENGLTHYASDGSLKCVRCGRRVKYVVGNCCLKCVKGLEAEADGAA